jgi:hypothetical protein
MMKIVSPRYGVNGLQKVSVIWMRFKQQLLGGFLGETVLEKVEEIGKRLDELRDFL